MPDAHQEEMDRLFSYDKKRDVITYIPKDYEIYLGGIRSPQRLLGWVLHLGDKPWMPKEVLCEFVQRVADIKGWNPYRC